MTLLMDVLPEQLGEWADILSGQSYVWQATQLVPGQLEAPKGHLVLLAEQLTKSALSQSLQVLDSAGVRVEIASLKRIAEREVLNLRLSAWSPQLKAQLQEIATSWDIACVPALPNGAQPGLVLMDMDSTAIQIECIDEIARLYGVGEQVSAVTAQAMNGELDFNQSLRTRVALLKGADQSILNQVIDNMPLMPGLEVLIAGLKQAGWKVCIASGGFTYFAQALKQQLGFDQVFANTLEIIDGKLTGQVLGDIVNADVKARLLGELAQEYGISLNQTVAIGDGANDLLMLSASALGVAIHDKPVVVEQAAVSINHLNLEAALCILHSTECAAWA